eukprot:SAG31_NODE_5127_length_2725_cov_1.449353_3_plen_129_part_00
MKVSLSPKTVADLSAEVMGGLIDALKSGREATEADKALAAELVLLAYSTDQPGNIEVDAKERKRLTKSVFVSSLEPGQLEAARAELFDGMSVSFLEFLDWLNGNATLAVSFVLSTGELPTHGAALGIC